MPSVDLLDMRAVAALATELGGREVPEQTIRWKRSKGELPAEDFMVGQSPCWLRASIEPWVRHWVENR